MSYEFFVFMSSKEQQIIEKSRLNENLIESTVPYECRVCPYYDEWAGCVADRCIHDEVVE